MKLTEFRSLLTQHREKPFRLLLPRGEAVPLAFHITEVAHVAKRFIDCGGKLHTDETVQFQAWVGEDADHRLTAPKLLGILEKSDAAVLPPNAGELPVTVEYEDGLISQYPVDGYAVEDGAVVLWLGTRHTDCLAREICIAPRAAAEPAATPCCCSGQC